MLSCRPVVCFRALGASFTQRTISSIPIGGSISPEGFLLPILLLVVIIVTVVIVIVILIVVVDDVSLILKLSFTQLSCAFRAEEMPSLISCRMAAKVMAGVSDVDVLLGGILSTKDNAEITVVILVRDRCPRGKDYQLADLFTKALPVDRFNYLVCRLGMRSLSPQELERLAKSQ
ncbi:hypothetical protein Tco_1049727 [Tanacetum coccineum]